MSGSTSAAEPGAPVGRRVVLGMLAVGGLGVAFGGRVQSAITTALGPMGASDLLPGGGGWR